MIRTIELRLSIQASNRVVFDADYHEALVKKIKKLPTKERSWVEWNKTWEFDEKHLDAVRGYCKQVTEAEGWLFIDRWSMNAEEIVKAIAKHREEAKKISLAQLLQILPKLPERLRVVAWREDSLLLQIDERLESELFDELREASLRAGYPSQFNVRIPSQRTPFLDEEQWIFEMPDSAEIINMLVVCKAEHLQVIEPNEIEKVAKKLYCFEFENKEWLAMPLSKIKAECLHEEVEFALSKVQHHRNSSQPYWNIVKINGNWHIANLADDVLFCLLHTTRPECYLSYLAGEGFAKITSIDRYFDTLISFAASPKRREYFEEWCRKILRSRPVLRWTRRETVKGLVAEDWLHPFQFILEYSNSPDLLVPAELIEIAPEIIENDILRAVLRTRRETRHNAKTLVLPLLNKRTKDELIALGSHYELTLKKTWLKPVIIDNLQECQHFQEIAEEVLGVPPASEDPIIPEETDAILASQDIPRNTAILGGLAGIKKSFAVAKNNDTIECELLQRCLQYDKKGLELLAILEPTTERGKALQKKLIQENIKRPHITLQEL